MSSPQHTPVNPYLRTLGQSRKLQNVAYEIRGPVHAAATRMEAEGHRILKLNIGNPPVFDLQTPDVILRDVIAALSHAQGYTEAKGILSARRAIVTRYELVPGFPYLDVDDVFLGNGVSELITMTLQALLDDGDEVLIPTPDYPLWTAATALAGGTPVHYLCDETQDWNPNLDDIEARITPNTKAIVVINPNNPTGAVYSRQVLDGIVSLARKYSLLILADEIYDQILFDDSEHVSIASRAHDLFCITYNGLSKTYRAPGFRSGWMVLTGPKDHAKGFLEGLETLAATRLCPNAPAQYAIQVAVGGYQSIRDLVRPGGRLREQRDAVVEELVKIPGVSCVVPKGAMYVFPRLDPEVHEIHNDEQLALDLLLQEKILIVQGTGFNWPHHDHLRIVTLAPERDLRRAIERFGNFLASYRQ
ncbi:pyridoxal phosphate-dependent aminotransferase [Segniliparus rugosus]|uniref:alanine transaminase n=1 Tax=Segniliparus rugosus (strain ATCC BAA-974 / DSM 45345 / CCUG 50838 / CIP 108380 / JCM 13579 / CDC 945) TaxID=679197 RepID=E5XN43_SEGRC|nr:pyridoxal phosphate-dependent aminotransferase [Segniliparus rugosus]EFV14237.1 hypothetical protein HMPREF9336_00913 [Segniliparus rugosus ATCC BAA-974]